MEPVYSLIETIIHHLWSVSWQVTILAAIIWIIDRLSFWASPLFKYWLWMIVLVRLCIPANIMVPAVIEKFIDRSFGMVTPDIGKYIPFQNLNGDLIFQTKVLNSDDKLPDDAFTIEPVSQSTEITLVDFSGFLWFAVIIIIIAFLCSRIYQVRNLLKGGVSVGRPDITSLVKKHQRELGIRRPVGLYSMDTDAINIPAVIGILNPRIILPKNIVGEWSAKEIEPVILHELAHIKRFDLLVNLLQIIVQTVYFFHPLVWFANRQIRRMREEVCDDIAVQRFTGERARYTSGILRVMENSLYKKRPDYIGIGFSEKKSTIGERIRRIMNNNYRNTTSMTVLSVITLVIIGVFALLLSCEHSPVKEELTETGKNIAQKSSVKINIPAEYVIGASPLNREVLEKIAGLDESDTPDFNITIATAWAHEIVPTGDFIRSVQSVAEGVDQYSAIEVTHNDQLYLDSPDIFSTAVVFISADKPFKLTKAEQTNLNKYIQDGGFVVINNSTSEETFSSTERSLRKILNDAITGDFSGFIVPVPNDHPMFSAYFDFDGGPPSGKTYISQDENYIEGLWQGNRLYALYWDHDYTQKWIEKSQPHLKFGVNMVIYGLLREGGILHK